MRLGNKVAIITGAGKGIGWGIAKVFSEEGAKVVVVDWDEEAGKKTAEGIRRSSGDAIFVHCDVSNEEQVKSMVQATIDKHGRIDVLVNNAGIGGPKSVLEATKDDWERVLGVNLKGVVLCSKYAIPHMQAAGKGAIVNISSVHSHATRRRQAPYAASKGAITALTRNMALDFAPAVRVNVIAPGWVLTPRVLSIFDRYDDPVEQRRLVEEAQPMKRLGRPEDIGHAAAFLASDEASFITGTELFVDGGLTAELEPWSR